MLDGRRLYKGVIEKFVDPYLEYQLKAGTENSQTPSESLRIANEINSLSNWYRRFAVDEKNPNSREQMIRNFLYHSVNYLAEVKHFTSLFNPNVNKVIRLYRKNGNLL
jgi:hypothetical protein